MKIKCKKCGKNFDPEIYSGLCPKCGTYNGVHMDETDLSQYLSSSYSGEEAHQKLHEMYGDTGHDQEAHRSLHERYGDTGHDQEGHRSLHERYGDTGHDQDAHKKLHERYDRSYRAAHPIHTRTERKVKSKGAASRRWVLLLLLLVFVPMLCISYYLKWEREILRSVLDFEVYSREATEGNSLILGSGSLESPIHVTVTQAGEVFLEEGLQEGKKLVSVKTSIASEDYNFGTALEVALQYQSGENTFYQMPLDTYALQDYLPLLGIGEEELMPAYNPGNGQENSGYYFFIAAEDARDMKLFFTLRENSELQRVFEEAEISLESVWSREAGKGEAE